MIVNVDAEKLANALEDFYHATGINLNLMDTDFVPFGHHTLVHNDYCNAIQGVPKGRAACGKSDRALLEKCRQSRQAEMHVCHAGLIDIAFPLEYEDRIIAYIVMGQIKKNTDFSALSNYLSGLSLNVTELESCYNELTSYDDNRINSVKNLAVMLTKYILLEDLLKPDPNKDLEKATRFINDNLAQALTIQMISEHTHLSKTVLYKLFHSHLNCTIMEYINGKRIEKAVDMLLKTDLSMEEIARRTGFANAAYFSRSFKKCKGISPVKFRKNHF